MSTTSSSTSTVSPHLQVGNRVKLLVGSPAANIEGVVEGCDTFGSVILSHAKTTLIPLSDEEKARLEQERRERSEEGEELDDDKKNAEPAKLQLVLSSRIKDVVLLAALQTGGEKLRAVYADTLPRKRLFVSDMDSLLGRAVCAKFGAAQDWDIAGTRCCTAPTYPTDKPAVPFQAGTIVPSFREDPVAFKTAVLHADVVVCTLRDDTTDAAAALRILSNSLFDDEKVFILVSSVLTWAETAKALKAKAAADVKAEKEAIRKERIEAGEDPEDDEDNEETNNNDANSKNDEEGGEEEPPAVFSDSNDHERVPHPRYQHWRLLEQATKFANSESLHTYVLTAGLLYGMGEESLGGLFSAAWHREPLPVVCALGANVVPTIHVKDLASAIYNCSNTEEVHSNRYVLAVDGGNNTTQEIVNALCKAMGDPNDAPLLYETPLGAMSRGFDLLSLDLRLEATNFGQLLGGDDWVAQEGLVASMSKVAAEYRATHGLTPLRVAVTGPPDSGKTQLATWIAREYGVEHITVQNIIDYYTKHRQQVFKKLLAHRERRKEEAARRRAEEEDEENRADGSNVDDRASAGSGGNSTESGPVRGGGAAAAATAKRAAAAARRRAAAAAGDDDDDEEAELSDEEWSVQFRDATPPPVAGRQPADSGSDNGTEDGGSRPTSSRGANSARGGRNDDDDDDESNNNKGPAVPEVEAAEDKEDDDEEDEVLAQLKEDLRLCNRVVTLKNPANGRYIDHAVAVMARYKLMHAAQAKNQGYVLDGFPKTTRQAAFTFSADQDVAASLPEFDEEGKLPEEVLAPVDPADDSGEQAALLESVDADLMFENAIVLDASDTVIVSRASDFGSNSVQRLQRLYRRLAHHTTYNSRVGKPSVSVQSWMRAILTTADSAPSRSVAVLSIDTDVAWPVTGTAAVAQVESFLGKSHVVHPTVAELEQAATAAAGQVERAAVEAKTAAVADDKRRARDEAERQAVAATNQRRLMTCTDEEQAAAAVCSIPAQQYLTDYIAAPLASCVASVARVRPEDPLTVLSDALYQYDAPIVHAKEILTRKKRSSSSNNSTPTGTPRRHE